MANAFGTPTVSTSPYGQMSRAFVEVLGRLQLLLTGAGIPLEPGRSVSGIVATAVSNNLITTDTAVGIRGLDTLLRLTTNPETVKPSEVDEYVRLAGAIEYVLDAELATRRDGE